MILQSLVGGLVVAAGLTVCSSDPDPAKPASTPVLEVGVGTCMLVAEDIEPEPSKLPTISCAKAHTHEVFFVYTDKQDDVFPGVSALVTIAKRECYKTFEDYVGISPFDSSLQITWIVPSLGSWNGADKDRAVLCLNRRTDGGQLTGTTKGSNL